MALSDFWTKIRRLFRSPSQHVAPVRTMRPPRAPSPAQTQRLPVVSPQPVVPQPPQVGPLDGNTVIATIYKAARLGVLLNIKYNGISRLVEGYSFRDTSSGRVFFGFCLMHGRTHSFKIEKIESIELTQQQFQPRWPVEL